MYLAVRTGAGSPVTIAVSSNAIRSCGRRLTTTTLLRGISRLLIDGLHSQSIDRPVNPLVVADDERRAAPFSEMRRCNGGLAIPAGGQGFRALRDSAQHAEDRLREAPLRIDSAGRRALYHDSRATLVSAVETSHMRTPDTVVTGIGAGRLLGGASSNDGLEHFRAGSGPSTDTEARGRRHAGPNALGADDTSRTGLDLAQWPCGSGW